MSLLTKMWHRQERAQGQEVFEMASALEGGGGTRPVYGNGDNKEIVNEKAGNEEDQMHMRRIGKTPVLKRGFKGVPLVAFAVILGNTAPWSLMSIEFSLTNGGTAGAIWMCAIVAFCMFFVVLVIYGGASEQCTNGWWTIPLGFRICAPKVKLPMSQSEIKTLTGARLADVLSRYGSGTRATVPSGCHFVQHVVCIQWYAIHRSRNGWETELTALSDEGWLGTLITIGLTCIATFINVFGYRKLPIIEGLTIPVYFAVFIALLVVFWMMGDRGGKEVFTKFSSNGWPTVPMSCLVAILGPVQTFMGSDAQAHLAEETMDAARVVPRAMVATALINYSIGLSMVVTVMYVLGPDIDAIRNTPTGVPVVEVLLRTTGSVQATAAFSCLVGLLFVCCLTNNVTTGSRQLWSFARDKGIPFHEYFAKVSPTKETPVRAIMFTLAITAVLSLFNIGSTVALSTLVSLSLTGLVTSYTLTILSILSYRIRGGRLPASRFNLGRKFGFVCNTIALMFLSVVLVMVFFPTSPHPQPADMNWSVVMYGFVTVVLLVFYFRHAKDFYDGPVKTVMQQ
ncbi:hypothetical protein Q7P37_009877 [Cladosporium fusiforme]